MEPTPHYKAYKPKPFTKEQRKDTTLLFGGLTWKHERLIQGAFHNLNYKAEPLPNITRADLDTGKELIDVGACCPTIFTTGNLVNYLKKKKEEEGKEAAVNDYAYFTMGACGPCRFGQYRESYSMALDGIGLRDFRMFFLSQTELNQGDQEGGGLEVNMPLTTGIVWAILIGDLLTDLEFQTRPYEVVPGQTNIVLKECIEIMYQAFKNRPIDKIKGNKWLTLGWHVVSNYFTDALKEVIAKWKTIEVNKAQAKPMVKITGEFWLQTHEGDGNYNIKDWLEKEGAEVIPPPVAVWLDYLMQFPLHALNERKNVDKGTKKKILMLKGMIKMYHWTYNRMRKSLNEMPYEMPSQKTLAELAAPYFNFRLDGGEGHMLIGKALYAYLNNKAHMTCELTPYSCMPNTMSVGAMANVRGKYPELLYAPIEIKGDAEIHALSRCQMILTEAKKRALKEYDEVMKKCNMTPEKLEWIALNAPEYKEASFKVPHNGYAGTGANYITMLSQYKGKLTKTLKKTATVTPKPIAAETVLTEVAATETVTVQEPELTYA